MENSGEVPVGRDLRDDSVRERQRRSADSYQRDARFRALAQSVVHQALHEYGPVEPEDAQRAASEIATRVAVLLLQGIYEEDAELRAQKALADRYMKLAEEALAIRPMPPVFLGPDLRERI